MHWGKTRQLTMAALFSALIFLSTAYLLHIPVGSAGGYIHLGDVFVYLAGAFLPLGFAMPAAAIGAGLADILTGASVWALPSMIIKPLLILFFDPRNKKILCGRNLAGALFGMFVTIGGYYLAEGFLFSNFVAPLYSLLANLVQALSSAVIFFIVGFFLDRGNFKARIG